jgi:hypothetical protein
MDSTDSSRTSQPKPDYPGFACQLYRIVLNLYPPGFRSEFASEMADVFCEAARSAAAQGRGALLQLWLRELADLPASLAREYKDEWIGAGGEQMPATGVQVSGMEREQKPGTWRDAGLAIIPFAFVAFVTLLQMMLRLVGVENGSPIGLIFMIPLFIGGGILMIICLVRARREGWPSWFASWSFIIIIISMAIFVLLETSGLVSDIQANEAAFFIIPLMIAVWLYRMARRRRLDAILASLPITSMLWTINMEMVPDGVRSPVVLISFLMIGLAVGLMVRLGEWRTGLWLALWTMLMIGALYVYAGIFHSGLRQPGSGNFAEWLEMISTQYVAFSVLLCGPLLGRLFRDVGQRSGKAGRLAYRMALFGLLVILYENASLLTLSITSGWRPQFQFYGLLEAAAWAGLGLYVLGSALLAHAAHRQEALPDGFSTALMFILPLGLPLLMLVPAGNSLVLPFQFPHGLVVSPGWSWVAVALVGILWLSLTVWLLTHESPSKPPVAESLPGLVA